MGVYNLLFGFFRLFWYRGWSDGRRQTPLWHWKKNAPGPRIPAISKANETKESLSEKRRRDYQVKRTRSKKWKNIRGYSNARVLQRYYLLFFKTRVISMRSEVLEKKDKMKRNQTTFNRALASDGSVVMKQKIKLRIIWKHERFYIKIGQGNWLSAITRIRIMRVTSCIDFFDVSVICYLFVSFWESLNPGVISLFPFIHFFVVL